MTRISNHYIKVEKVEDPPVPQGQYSTVKTQDSYIYEGRIVAIPHETVTVGNHILGIGDIIHFAKYSPDTHEVNGYKFIKIDDILEVL